MLQSPRFILFLVWFIGYAIAFLVVCSLAPMGLTVVDALASNLTQLTGLYAPYVGPVVCYWFAKDVAAKSDTYDRPTFIVALTCSVFFNLALWAIVTSIYFRDPGEAKVEQTLTLMSQVSTLLAFLVGPAIGFFFGKVGTDPNPRRLGRGGK